MVLEMKRALEDLKKVLTGHIEKYTMQLMKRYTARVF